MKKELLKREIRGITFNNLDAFDMILNIDKNHLEQIELSAGIKVLDYSG